MATIKAQTISDDYLELVKRFPLVRIKNDLHLKAAHKMIDELSIISEEDLTAGQLDYLLVLGDLTTVYEQDAMDEITRDCTGLELLKAMAEEHGLTPSDIGRIIGQRELGAKVVKGDRAISRSHAQALGKRFAVPAELFLR